MKKTGKTAALALTMSMAVTAMPFGVSAEETDKTVVRINMESEPDNLDPWLSAASDTEAVFHNVFEGLVLFDETGALTPGLAESWDISDDGLTYTFSFKRRRNLPQWKGIFRLRTSYIPMNLFPV